MDNEKVYCRYCLQPLTNAQAKFCPHCGRSQPVTEIHQLPPGTVLHNKIIIGSTLGEGGFGITYLGRDRNLDIPVAVKEYYPYGFVNRIYTVSAQVTCSSDEEKKDFFERGRARFLQEARVLARFSGKRGIVAVHDFFEENNTAYIVMEYLDGKTLKQYVDEHGAPAPDGKHKLLTPAETLRLLTPVMQSLQLLHKENVIHRDISPDNIMVLDDDVKLLDFGAARVMDSGNKSRSVMLKPGYAPWEQYSSKGDQGPCTDIYALCATIYECVTGRRPPEAPERMEQDPLKRPSELGVSVPKSMETALLKGLAVYPADRYQDIAQMMEDLQRPDPADNVISVVYNPNGGAYPPASQETSPGAPLTLAQDIPAEAPCFVLRFDPCGGERVADIAVPRRFTGWNTAPNGAGTTYLPGGTYSGDSDLLLYAQWDFPDAGELPPTFRGRDIFLGWYTAPRGGEPAAYGLKLAEDTTLYAHWEKQDDRTIISTPPDAEDNTGGRTETVTNGNDTTILIHQDSNRDTRRQPADNNTIVIPPDNTDKRTKPENNKKQKQFEPGPAPQDPQKKKRKPVVIIAAALAVAAAVAVLLLILHPWEKDDPSGDTDKTESSAVDVAFASVIEGKTVSRESSALSLKLGVDAIEIYDDVTEEEAEKWVNTVTDNGYTRQRPFGQLSENEYVLDNAAQKKGFIAGFMYDDDGSKTSRFAVLTAENDDYATFIGYDGAKLLRAWSNWNWEGRFLENGNVIYGRALDAAGMPHLATMNPGASSAKSLYQCNSSNIVLLDDTVYFGEDTGKVSCTVFSLNEAGEATQVLENVTGLQAYCGQLLYTKCTADSNMEAVCLCDPDGKNSRTLLEGNNWYAYAVGNLLFYQNDVADDNAADMECVYNLLTGETREITDETTYGFVSDGKNAYYSVNGSSQNHYNVFRMDLESGKSEQIAANIFPSPMVMGDSIYYLNADNYLPCRLDGETETVIGQTSLEWIYVCKDKLICVSKSAKATSFADPDGGNVVTVTVN